MALGDFATSAGNRIDFFSTDVKTHSIVGFQLTNVTALAYDALHDTLLLLDQQTDNATVYSFNFTSNHFQPILTRKDIISFAIDPVKELIFWIEERSIFSMTLNSPDNSTHASVVLKLDDAIPRDIAVDTCSEYVYWTSTNSMKPAIEKARFDGSERQVLIDQDIHEPHGLVIDPQINKMYWFDITRNGSYKYRVHFANLAGHDIEELLYGGNPPIALTVSKDLIYFIEKQEKAVWKGKKIRYSGPLEHIGSLHTEIPTSIVAKYTIQEQTKGIHKCETLISLLQENSMNNDTFHVASDFDRLICDHGEKANVNVTCKCLPGYIGERCDVSVCQNYCIQGTCSVSDEGEPSCGCESGYSGARCEVNMCFNYCLNSGVCNLTEENKPVCQCVGNNSGSRCENDTDSPTYKSVDKNFTSVDAIFNRGKINGKVTVYFELESK